MRPAIRSFARGHFAASALLFAALAPEAHAQYPRTPPPAASLKPAQFPPFQETALPNGLRLVVVERRDQPLVSISLSFPAGSRYEPSGHEGLATLAATLLTKGAGARSADEISATIEGVGGSIGASAGSDFLTVRADVLTPNVPLAFELLSDVAVRPSFPEKELELARTQILSALQLELSQPSAIASRAFARELYGKNPYALRPTPESVRRVARSDLVAFQKARLRPSGALLVVAGDLSFADARRLASRSFAGWKGAPIASAASSAPPARRKTEIVLVHRPGSVQSNIVMGNVTFLPGDPRFFAVTVANRVLGSSASARLFNILREQKSWTYGAYSNITRPQGIGSFQVTAEVRTEVTDSAVAEMITQVRRIAREQVGTEEFSAAMESLVGAFPLTIQTANQVAAAVTNAKLLGLPPDYLQTYRTRLAVITPPMALAAARSSFRGDAALIVVVGDATKIHDGLKAIAPVRLVTTEGMPLAASALTATAGPLNLDMTRLVARSDSFVVMVQGNAFGFQRTSLEKNAGGYTYTEATQIGAIVNQTTTLTFGEKLDMRHVTQRGTMQGQELKTDVTYSGGRVKGSAMTPTPQGVRTVAIDTAIAAGTLDDNAVQAIVPALKWTPNAKFQMSVFSAGQGGLRPMTLNVAGKESVMVPAGTFDVYRAELTGGQAPVTLFVTTAAPHRVVKVTIAGAPIEFLLVK